MQVALRAVSARNLLTPLAVLVPILATVVAPWLGLAGGALLVLLALVVGFVATAIGGHFTYGVRVSLVTAALTLLTGFVAIVVWYAVSINMSICGKDIDPAWAWLPLTGGALVFFVVGSIGFRSGRPWSMVPMALLAGVLAMATLIAVVPGTQGTCET
ncbi:MAG TPA: hypothetical protein VH541_09830 [Gaiellaceae bacterium]|jgi:hypothetical protein